MLHWDAVILLTNDDGIFAPGLWALAKELSTLDRVMVVAPDREQSASGTAVTLRQPLRVQAASPVLSGIEAFAVEGTPCDSVILALGKLAQEATTVISGINGGLNLGDDVFISGTVGAALQGYLRNLPAMAVSVATISSSGLESAARLVRLIVQRIKTGVLPSDIFLNINLPDLPLSKMKGLLVTQPAHKTHIDSVEEGNDGKRDFYWLVRSQIRNDAPENTDIWALEHGYITLTPLHTTLFRRPAPDMGQAFCSELMQELKTE